MDKLKDIAKKYNLVIIEDAAQGLKANLKTKVYVLLIWEEQLVFILQKFKFWRCWCVHN